MERQAAVAAQARIAGFDALRIAATFFVVWGHVATSGVYWRANASDPDWLFADTAFVFSRWAVPVFLMLMGALLAARSAPEFSFTQWKRRLARILALTGISACTYMLACILWTPDPGPAALAGALLGGPPFFHLWFLYLACGIYLFAPVVLYVEQRIPALVRYRFLAMLFAASAVACWPGTGLALKAIVGVAIASYFVIGVELQRWPPPSGREAMIWIFLFLMAGLVAVVIGAAFVGQLGWGGFEYPTSFGHPFIAVMAIALFRLSYFVPALPGLALAGRVTPIIYVVHPLAIGYLTAHSNFGLWPQNWIGIPLVSLVAFSVSLAFAYGLILAAEQFRRGTKHVSQQIQA